ncbi:glycosyltransferase family 2 protein [Afipia birgiae]|uniref:glycosyltransferase family 2 protein n=1 Tax=Afipia birgiae TaxID=151414 RepID=UPI00138E36C5|nr:glycosyltransferase family 2 protein [Afipia birgiae]
MKNTEVAPVSVVIPTYRDGDALRRALVSVENQTLQPAQVIVVDDGSPDDNADKVCAASSLKTVQLITLNQNVGPGEARNAGIAASRERFIAFLDADDEWHPEKLERQMSVMLEPGAPLLTGHEKGFDGISWPKLSEPVKRSPIQRRSILLSNCASISTVIIKKDAIKYLFSPAYAGEDYVFVAANVLSGAPSALLNQILARADKEAFGAGGLSGRLHAMQLGEMRARDFLLREGLITKSEHAAVLVWSLLKYCRRVVIVSFRRAMSWLAGKRNSK